MYFQLHGIRQQRSENKSAHKKSCYFSSPKNKKRLRKQKAKASKSFGIPLCKQANKNKRTGKGVGTDFFPVHVTFSNYDLLTRGSNQFI